MKDSPILSRHPSFGATFLWGEEEEDLLWREKRFSYSERKSEKSPEEWGEREEENEALFGCANFANFHGSQSIFSREEVKKTARGGYWVRGRKGAAAYAIFFCNIAHL